MHLEHQPVGGGDKGFPLKLSTAAHPIRHRVAVQMQHQPVPSASITMSVDDSGRLELDPDALAGRSLHLPDAVLAGRVQTWKVEGGDDARPGDALVAARPAVVGACDPLAPRARGAGRTPAAAVAVHVAAVETARNADAVAVTLVQEVGQVNVAVGEVAALADLARQQHVVGDDGRQAVLAEGEAAVVHQGAEVVLDPARLLVGAHREVVLVTGNDVSGEDGDVRVAVAARLLVPEAESVANLVRHDPERVAACADADQLARVAAHPADVRPAAG